MRFLTKLQDLPEGKKKIILYFLVGLTGILLFSFYFVNTGSKIKNISGEKLKESFFPREIQQGLKKGIESSI